jgi:hypothetical protein
LKSELDSALRAANPLKDSCDQQVCVFGACACIFRSKVEYLDIRVVGPNTSTLSLVTGGLRAVATIRDVGLRARVSGTPPTSTGWADISYVTIDLTMDAALVNGRPTMTVRQINSVSVGDVSLSFSGFTGLIIDILETLFEGTIRNLVRDTVRDFIESSFNQVLDGVFAGLDISTLGSSFSVPRLDGQGNVTLNFGLSFTSILVSSVRALFGIGTKFSGPQSHAYPSLGVPMPVGSVRTDAISGSSVLVGVHVGLLNQALHALWRGNFFEASLDSTTLGSSVPPGLVASIVTALPPVVENIGNNKMRLMMGAVRLSLIYPGIFDDPLDVVLGAKAVTDISIVGDDLSFGNVVLEDLVFSTKRVTLDATTRSVLEDFLETFLQGVIDSSLNSALPSLPIPAFEIPASLGTYGLPVGAEMGVIQPTLRQTTRHELLEGAFGIR